MLKNLVTVANRLDSLGLSKEADFIDQMITKYSMYFDDGYFTCDRCGGLHHETNTVRMGSKDLCPDCVDLIIKKRESIQKE